MIGFSNAFWLIALPNFCGILLDHVVAATQTSHQLAIQAHTRSQYYSLLSTNQTRPHNKSHIMNTRTSGNPETYTKNGSAYDNVASRSVDIFDHSAPSCTASGVPIITISPQSLHLNDECLLWDDSCSRNRTLALEEFFGTYASSDSTLGLLLQDP